MDPNGRLRVSDFGDLLLFDPGVTVNDFVISDDMQLYGIASDDIVVQIDVSTY